VTDEPTKEVLHFINTNPEVLSVLYDVNLLPEQTMKDPRQWLRTLLVVRLFQRIQAGDTRLVDAFRSVVDIGSRRLLLPEEVTHWQALLAEHTGDRFSSLPLPTDEKTPGGENSYEQGRIDERNRIIDLCTNNAEGPWLSIMVKGELVALGARRISNALQP